ncbi:MAG: hypothetical protein PQJ46_16610 [Spirochaetales bacterium]|nr:hypothetical protein [Spirochaetales bacterium]
MKKHFFILLFLLLVFFSCTTVPEAPLWVLETPVDTEKSHLIVTAGLSPSGNEEEATTAAIDKAIKIIDSLLDVDIQPDMPVEVIKIYDSFMNGVQDSLNGDSYGSLSGIVLKDKWVEVDGTRLIVYILVDCNKALIKSENKLIEDKLSPPVLEDSISDVSNDKVDSEDILKDVVENNKNIPLSEDEKTGDTLSDKGNGYDAVLSYIDAVVEEDDSKDSDVQEEVNPEDKEKIFKRNIAKAVESVRKLSMEKVSGPDHAYIGEKFDKSFRVRILSSGKPAVNLPVSVSYKELQDNGRKITRKTTILSDSSGNLVFRPPVPGWAGIEKVVFCLDMSSTLDPLKDVDFNLLQYVDELDKAVSECCVSFDVDIRSRALEIPTCIMIMDVDRSGNPISKTDTAAAVEAELIEAGFNVKIIPVDYRMTAMTDLELIKAVKDQYSDSYSRFIFGTAEISSFEENDGSVTMKVAGKVKAAELDSENIILSLSEQKRARGRNNQAIVSAAFNSLGRLFGERLMSELP